MEEAKILARFEEIQKQLAKERKARLHAWIPRSVVVLALAIFAFLLVSGLGVVQKQTQDRAATRQQICLAINENKSTVKDLIVAVRDQSPDPSSVQAFLEKFQVELKPIDCNAPFVSSSPTTAPTTTAGG